MTEMWQFMQSVQGGGYRHTYGEPVVDKARKDTHLMVLDEVRAEIIAGAELAILKEWAYELGLKFSIRAIEILTDDGRPRLTPGTEEDWVQDDKSRRLTSRKWCDNHIKFLGKWGILRCCERKDAKVHILRSPERRQGRQDHLQWTVPV